MSESTHATGTPGQIVDGYRIALEVVLGIAALGLAVIGAGLLSERRAAQVQTEAQTP